MHAIRFEAVNKTFGTRLALDNLSFTLEEGHLLGLLGPNGSGKTTTLRLLLNLFLPDAGLIEVLGEPPSRGLSDRIGYLPEERGLYRRMQVHEVLHYYTALKGVQVSTQEIDQWLERLGISQYRDQRVEALSKGTAQKVQFIGTVLHKPRLLILDEPFSGLDPVSRHSLGRAIRDLKAEGVTIILSTHDMGVAEEMCDTFMMLYLGRKVLDADAQVIAETYGERAIKVQVEGNGLAETPLPGVLSRVESGGYHQLALEHDADPQEVLKLLSSRHRLLHFEVGKPSLNDIFLRLAGGG